MNDGPRSANSSPGCAESNNGGSASLRLGRGLKEGIHSKAANATQAAPTATGSQRRRCSAEFVAGADARSHSSRQAGASA